MSFFPLMKIQLQNVGHMLSPGNAPQTAAVASLHLGLGFREESAKEVEEHSQGSTKSASRPGSSDECEQARLF